MACADEGYGYLGAAQESKPSAMSVKPAGRAKPQKVERGVSAEISWLLDRHDGAPNFEMRKFRIKPGGSIPKHYHPDIEHEQYVLKGKYKVGLGSKSHTVRAGDSIFIPKGTPHWYKNTGAEDAEFLCIIPKKEGYDTFYVEEGKK